MELLHTTRVTDDQIDHLGHMNVMHYGENAGVAAGRLADSLAMADSTRTVFQRDRYVRHHREQLLGSALEVRGGVLDVGPDRVRFYEELSNADTSALAATFILTMQLRRTDSTRPLDLPSDLIDRARVRLVHLPEHGRPRSISVDDDPTLDAPERAELSERGLAMREVRTITEAECAADGGVQSGLVADLVWGGTALEGHEFTPFHEPGDGTRIGWATMETRATWARRPRLGDRVQSFGAEVELADKTMLSRYWAFDVDSSELACTFSVVNVAFDVNRRRAVTIPDTLRAIISTRLHTDLSGERPAQAASEL